MELVEFSTKFAVAFGLGLLIAVEQVINNSNRKSAFSFQVFSLLAGLGAIAGMLTFAYPIVSMVFVAGVMLTIIGLLVSDLKEEINGQSVFAAIFSFVVGYFSFINLVPLPALIGVSLAVILQNAAVKMINKSKSLLKK